MCITETFMCVEVEDMVRRGFLVSLPQSTAFPCKQWQVGGQSIICLIFTFPPNEKGDKNMRLFYLISSTHFSIPQNSPCYSTCEAEGPIDAKLHYLQYFLYSSQQQHHH
jgi:hypothetical protein